MAWRRAATPVKIEQEPGELPKPNPLTLTATRLAIISERHQACVQRAQKAPQDDKLQRTVVASAAFLEACQRRFEEAA